MIHNRSVPVDTILPHLFYEDVAAALSWLTTAFGLTEHFRFELPDGSLHGALMYRGNAWVMLKSPGKSATSPVRLGGQTQQVMLFIDDIEVHYETARAARAKITESLGVTEYGEQQYVAEDPEGHQWIFAKHVRDIHPESWGARLAKHAEGEAT